VVSANGRGTELRLDAGVTVMTDTAGVPVGERAHAVVRPEKLRMEAAGTDAANEPSVEGVLESSLYLGTATQVVVRLPDKTAMTVLVPNTDEEQRSRLPAPGESVRLGWSQEHIHMVREAQGEAVAPPAAAPAPA
jgi:ABC-type Fe3+/spermidine/putrescine transport system ATPase subunit